MTAATTTPPARAAARAMTNPMGTLIAYEWQRTKGLIGTVLLITGALTVTGVLLALLPWEVVKVMGALVAVVATAMVLPALGLTLAVDYWRRAYGREGYLTQTLPVGGATQYAARMVYGALVMLVATGITVVLGALVVVVMGSVEMPGASLSDIARSFWAATPFAEQPWWLAGGLVVLWFTAVGYLLQFYCAASVGSESRWAFLKGAGPVVIWFGIYVASQVLMLVSVLALPWGLVLLDGQVQLVGTNWFQLMTASASADALPVGLIPALVLLTVVLYWRTRRSWEHKTSLR